MTDKIEIKNILISDINRKFNRVKNRDLTYVETLIVEEFLDMMIQLPQTLTRKRKTLFNSILDSIGINPHEPDILQLYKITNEVVDDNKDLLKTIS